jgi:hypothetical protein
VKAWENSSVIDGDVKALRLASATTFASGVLHLVYAPA